MGKLNKMDKEIIKICKYHYDKKKYKSTYDALKNYVSEIRGKDAGEVTVYNYLIETVKKVYNPEEIEGIKERSKKEIENSVTGIIRGLIAYLCILKVKDKEGNRVIDLFN